MSDTQDNTGRRPQHGLWIQTAVHMGRTARTAVSALQYPYVKAGQLVDRMRHSIGTDGPGRILFRTSAGARRQQFEAARLAADGGLSALAKTLSDPDPEVRMRALDVICEFSPDRATGLLTGVLHDPDPGVRCAGIWAAPMVTGMAIVYPLILALEDPDARVRTAAREVLTEITGRPISLSDTDAQETRRAKLAELKAWWKAQRVQELSESAERELGGS